jgi:threonine aldolase
MTSDGVPMTPREYAHLLARLTQERDIAVDSYSRDGAVAELESRMATTLGKECSVFLPTGTLANHLAVRLLAHGRRVLVQQESHLYCDEGDCAQRLSALNLVPLGGGQAAFRLAEVEEQADRGERGRVEVPVGAISIESPVRRKDGEVFPFAEMQNIAAYARRRGIGLHLDGARLFLATPYTGVTPAQYAALFDTVYVSMYKYFNATFGAILAGPRRLLENLYHTRRMFGGGLPHVWPEATVAMHFLDGFEGRFARGVSLPTNSWAGWPNIPNSASGESHPAATSLSCHFPAPIRRAWQAGFARRASGSPHPGHPKHPADWNWLSPPTKPCCAVRPRNSREPSSRPSEAELRLPARTRGDRGASHAALSGFRNQWPGAELCMNSKTAPSRCTNTTRNVSVA